jgi:hypothetical protein
MVAFPRRSSLLSKARPHPSLALTRIIRETCDDPSARLPFLPNMSRSDIRSRARLLDFGPLRPRLKLAPDPPRLPVSASLVGFPCSPVSHPLPRAHAAAMHMHVARPLPPPFTDAPPASPAPKSHPSCPVCPSPLASPSTSPACRYCIKTHSTRIMSSPPSHPS